VHVAGRVGGVENEVRAARLEVEGVRHNTEKLAEGIKNLEEKLDRHAAENDRQFDEIRKVVRLI
jgi:uncharacterized protein YoxC